MTITKLFIYIGIVALIILIAAITGKKAKNPLIGWIQYFVGGLFVFSGLVKAIDPVGTAIKMEEYFEVFIEYTPALEGFWHFWAHNALEVSIFFIVLEIFLGFTLLLGLYKKFTLASLVGIIVFFTFLTGFSHVTGKVTDCGCFGDFLKLTPYQSFMKDILLTVLIALLVLGHKHIIRVFKPGGGHLAIGVLTILFTWFTLSNYYDLPVKDFRAYKIGTVIPECTQLPTDAKPYVYEITYIYKNKETGEEKEFVNSFPEDFSKWDYVDRKDKLVQKGDDPKCKDFNISDIDGVEVTEDIFAIEGPVLMITTYDISEGSRKGFKRLARVVNEGLDSGQPLTVIGLTGSSLDDAEALRHDLGLPVTFYNLDAVPIKTMNRSNPGLVLMRDGEIIDKWHHRKVQSFEKLEVGRTSSK